MLYARTAPRLVSWTSPVAWTFSSAPPLLRMPLISSRVYRPEGWRVLWVGWITWETWLVLPSQVRTYGLATTFVFSFFLCILILIYYYAVGIKKHSLYANNSPTWFVLNFGLKVHHQIFTRNVDLSSECSWLSYTTFTHHVSNWSPLWSQLVLLYRR